MARPSAQGQATTSTATHAVIAACGSAPAPSQKPSTVTATASTTGTNTPATASASRCARALPAWASVTSRVIRASCVSAPIAVARTSSRPPALTAPPTSAEPGPTSTGSVSPVTRDRSTAELPSTTRPSVATRSPGRTTKTCPTLSCSIGTERSPCSSRTDTSLAASPASDRRAAPVPRLARASRNRPVSTNSGTPTAASRYTWAAPSDADGSRLNGIRMPGSPAPPRNRAYADHEKDATTPSETRVSMVAVEWRSPRTARTWNGQALHTATGAASTKHSHCQLRNCRDGAIDSTRTGTASSAVTSRRSRSCRAAAPAPSSSPAVPSCPSGAGGSGSDAS